MLTNLDKQVEKIVERILKERKQELAEIERQDIELLLRNLKRYKTLITQYQYQLEHEESITILNKGENIAVQGSKEYKSNLDKVEERKTQIKAKMERLQHIVKKVEIALSRFDGTTEADIIKYRFIEDLPLERVRQRLDIGRKLLESKIDKVLNELRILIFM